MLANSKAWTGGSPPLAYWSLPRKERLRVRFHFRQQIGHCGRPWLFSSPSGVLGYARILWNRARHDAHASSR